jgi:hypothetical protein
MEDVMSKTRHAVFALAVLSASASAAQANFFFEGLQPFSERHCIDFDPTLEDPKVIAPPSAVEGTPGAWSIDDRPYAAPACATGKPGKFEQPRHHRQNKPSDAVPQK